jgi:hypothetical protein
MNLKTLTSGGIHHHYRHFEIWDNIIGTEQHCTDITIYSRVLKDLPKLVRISGRRHYPYLPVPTELAKVFVRAYNSENVV